MTVDKERLEEAIYGEVIEDHFGTMCGGDKAVDAVLADIAAQGFVIIPRNPTTEMLESLIPEPTHLFEGRTSSEIRTLQAATLVDRIAAVSAWSAMIAAYEGKSG